MDDVESGAVGSTVGGASVGVCFWAKEICTNGMSRILERASSSSLILGNVGREVKVVASANAGRFVLPAHSFNSPRHRRAFMGLMVEGHSGSQPSPFRSETGIFPNELIDRIVDIFHKQVGRNHICVTI